MVKTGRLWVMAIVLLNLGGKALRINLLPQTRSARGNSCSHLLARGLATKLPRQHQLQLQSARPTLDDVERISYGQAAKKRGTGSRNVPHRLNEMERKEWEVAKKRRYLQLRGTGWRRERGDSPLQNIYRQLCDALNIPCIVVARGVLAKKGISSDSGSDRDRDRDGDIVDIVTIDFSTLRTISIDEPLAHARSLLRDNEAQFPSLLCVQDNLDSAFGELAPEEVDEMFNSQVNWRIQAFGCTATFSDRKEANAFAGALADALASRCNTQEPTLFRDSDTD